MTSGQYYSLDRQAVMIVLPQLSAEAAVERFEQRIQILPRNRLASCSKFELLGMSAHSRRRPAGFTGP